MNETLPPCDLSAAARGLAAAPVAVNGTEAAPDEQMLVKTRLGETLV